MTDTKATPAAGAARCALRPVVVPASLDALHGPVTGLVELPQRLFWSAPRRVFDLSDADHLCELYEAVLDAARTEADLAEYLDAQVLAGLWAQLAIAPRVRRGWEGAYPELARARHTAGALATA